MESTPAQVQTVPFDLKQSPFPQVAADLAELVHYYIKRSDQRVPSLKDAPVGEAILSGDVAACRAAFCVAMDWLTHLESERVRLEPQIEAHVVNHWDRYEVLGMEFYMTETALRRLLEGVGKRNLDLSDDQMCQLARLATLEPGRRVPTEALAALKCQARFVSRKGPLSADVLNALAIVYHEYADKSHRYFTKQVQPLASLLKGDDASVPDQIPVPPVMLAMPLPSPGHPGVFSDLKRHLQFTDAPPVEEQPELLEPGGFPLRRDSPLAAEHRIVAQALLPELQIDRQWNELRPFLTEGSLLGELEPASLAGVMLAVAERVYWATVHVDPMRNEMWVTNYATFDLFEQLKQASIVFDTESALELLLGCDVLPFDPKYLEPLAASAAKQPLTDSQRFILQRFAQGTINQPPMGNPGAWAKGIHKLLKESDGYWLVPGEVWTDQLHADVAAMKPGERAAWFKLVEHALSAAGSKPTKKWTAQADEALQAVTANAYRSRVSQWFQKVSAGWTIKGHIRVGHYRSQQTDSIPEGNADTLRGFVWMYTQVMDIATPRLVADLLLTSLKKLPGIGPRAVKVANACIWSLGEMAASDDQVIRDAALGQLARLKARVTFKTTLKAIEKALNKAAEAAGISRDDLEELGAPSFGFEGGVLTETLGDTAVELRVDRNKVVTQWTNAAGKVVKAPPAAAKRDHADAIKELKQAAKDAEGMLTAARARLDGLYLLDKSWTLSDWRERYLDHGLIGTIAGRLIWLVDDTPVMFVEGSPFDVKGKPATLSDGATVRLWHPIARDTAEVQAWRQFLEERKITQPFKQAHREVYILTDAERNTSNYSNRFAAHLIKQHQFNSLCGLRGWNNKLRLMVDDEYPPASRVLPRWNLRAEFWIEGAGDNYGVDTNESGTFLYLTTDQVRFYPAEAAQLSAHAGGGGYDWSRWRGEDQPEAIPLDQIPPLVFSEIMRDVDLFVGVASVGNDPNWTDGQSDGALRQHYHGYWRSYSFGDLSATAGTRKQVLQRLIPRLKIADRCSFTDRFLVVKGDIRTYKIHLGSGNIMMEPNDQYLCIVPKAASVDATDGKVFLPFEGDRTMSIILSKALLLADDTRIKDASIVSQIGRK